MFIGFRKPEFRRSKRRQWQAASKTLGGVRWFETHDDADRLTDIEVGGLTIKSFGCDAAGRTTSAVSGAGTTSLAFDGDEYVYMQWSRHKSWQDGFW
ncbi:MAG: hypothetical protein IT203_04245 [Fimbriimonadaceae bacterium]|nr:hypothetical protein [Fimbriimonadaceae bacterium]